MNENKMTQNLLPIYILSVALKDDREEYYKSFYI